MTDHTGGSRRYAGFPQENRWETRTARKVPLIPHFLPAPHRSCRQGQASTDADSGDQQRTIIAHCFIVIRGCEQSSFVFCQWVSAIEFRPQCSVAPIIRPLLFGLFLFWPLLFGFFFMAPLVRPRPSSATFSPASALSAFAFFSSAICWGAPSGVFFDVGGGGLIFSRIRAFSFGVQFTHRHPSQNIFDNIFSFHSYFIYFRRG